MVDRGRPKTIADEVVQLTFRLPVDLVQRLDQHVLKMRKKTPGLKIGRADVVRYLLTTALDHEQGSKKK